MVLREICLAGDNCAGWGMWWDGYLLLRIEGYKYRQASHQENSSDTSQESEPFFYSVTDNHTSKRDRTDNRGYPQDSLPSLSDTEKAIDSSQEGESPRVIGVGIQGAVQKPGCIGW